ncbi:MAG: hypothetical protein ACI4O3_07060 [Oscillospiraceae bacterium]
MNYTENHKLCLWEASDPIRREDFNAVNRIIDTAMAELAADRVVLGSYTGDGTTDRFFDLGFTPRALFFFVQFGSSNSQECFILTEQFVFLISSSQIMFTTTTGCVITENGFRVGGVAFNYSGKTDYYIAIR